MPQQVLANFGHVGMGTGHTARLIANQGGDMGIARPFCNDAGAGTFVSLKTGKKIKNAAGKWVDERKVYRISNSPASLSREDWLEADRKVAWQAKQRLQFANLIRSRNSINLKNGFGTAAYQYWFATGKADAKLSMDPIEPTERSKALMDAAHIPLPIAHSKGSFTARQLAIAENSRLPLNTTGIALAGRACAEIVENMFLGNSSFKFAEGTIYGLKNFPQALSAVFTNPTAAIWTPKVTLDEMLAAFEILKNKFYRGPYLLVYSNGWAPFFDTDYSTVYGASKSLRERLLGLPLISGMANIDLMDDYTMALIDMSDPEVFASINGVGPVTIQWQEEGGQLEKYMVMLQQIPLIKRDYDGYTGILNIAATNTTTSTTTTTTTTTSTTSTTTTTTP